MMKIWVVRHAKTLWNLENRYQGHTDIDLSPEGVNEISSWEIPAVPDVVFSSSLKRAMHTAQKLFPTKQIIVDDRLKEMNLGSWEGKTKKEVQAEVGEFPNDGWLGLDYCAHGGESVRQVIKRLQPFLMELAKRKEECVFLVSHKATISALYSIATGWDNLSKPKPRLRFPFFHEFALSAEGNLSLLRLNVPMNGSEGNDS